jgi:hypothetical protein
VYQISANLEEQDKKRYKSVSDFWKFRRTRQETIQKCIRFLQIWKNKTRNDIKGNQISVNLEEQDKKRYKSVSDFWKLKEQDKKRYKSVSDFWKFRRTRQETI